MTIKPYEQSLSAIKGKKITDIVGYVTAEYGDDTLVFKLTRILFEDGSHEDVEGEHDFPYIPSEARTQTLFEPYYKPDC